MPILSIITQPAENSLNAAYRPIVLRVQAQKTGGTAVPSIVYCDVYFNGVYYRTFSKTQYEKLNGSFGTGNTEWQFDIQDVVQEILQKYISANGFTEIEDVQPVIASIYCKFRSSGNDGDGFLVQEGTPPVQATSDSAAVAGTGYMSNTFYGLNATLQHEDNQSLADHLDTFKHRSWDATTYPLTHRPDHMRIDDNDSDAFPIVTDKTPGTLILHYKEPGQAYQVDSINLNCDAVTIEDDELGNPPDLPNAQAGIPYSYVINLGGTGPFSLSSVTKPTWMTITVVDSQIIFSGTPGPGDIGTDIAVSFDIKNCCDTNTVNFTDSIDVTSSSGSGTDFQFGNDIFAICSVTPATAYWSGTIGTGITLYQDSGFVTPYTGYDLVRRQGSDIVYTLNSATGEITGTTTSVC